MATDKLENPEYWRFRAEEVRTIAGEMKHGEPHAIMLRIAEDYDGIAKLVEQQLRDNRKLAASVADAGSRRVPI
jgi:hypothetical protein